MPYILMVTGKRRTFETIEKIEKTLGVAISPFAREELNHAQQRGDVLFATFNPYDAEMGTGDPEAETGILLARSQEDLDETFYSLREAI